MQGGTMELLIIVLNREEYFERLLSLLVEAGLNGATIVDSEGIGHFLAHEIPIFAGLKQLVGEGKSVNKTIMAVLEKKDIFDNLKRLLAEENIDFTNPGTGIIITVPVNEVIKPNNEPE